MCGINPQSPKTLRFLAHLYGQGGCPMIEAFAIALLVGVIIGLTTGLVIIFRE